MNRKMMVVIVIAAVMMFSGYAGAEEQLSPEEIKDMVLTNATEIDTYKFDMNVTMKMIMSNETNKTEMTTISNGRGVLDVVDKKMKLNVSTSMERNETTEVPGPMEVEMYLINNTRYIRVKMNLGIPGLPPQWTKMEMPEESWASQNQLEQQMELLDISEVELLADEELDGVDCYVLKIVPDMGKFWNSTMAAVRGRSTQGLAPGIDLRKILKSMSTKEWIAKDTMYLMKTQMAIRLVVRSEDLAIPDMAEKFTMTTDEKVEMLFYDYNKPVSIELPAGAEEQLSPEEIKDMVLTNATEIDTYKFDMNVTMKMLLSNETNDTEMTTISNGRGVLDVVDKKMKLNMNTSMESSETTEMPGPMEMEMYLINNTMYTTRDFGIPGLPPQWTKMEMPEESWASQNQLEQQMELLDISEVELLADEELDGVDCYVLKIVPDMGKFWNSTMAAVMARSTQGLAPGIDLRKILKSMSTKEWIAKDTMYLMKTQREIRLVVRSEAIPNMAEKFTMTADERVEMLFYDYNQPVSIELPEAAEAAAELPVMQMLN